MNCFTESKPRHFQWGSGTTASPVATATGFSNVIPKESAWGTHQAIVTGTGAVTATVQILATNDETTYQGLTSNWVLLGTITLTGTTSASDGFASQAPWCWVAANVTAISGTGAAVKVLMGV